MHNSLHQLLLKQYLILKFCKEKLDICNYIKNGYDRNDPILIDNSFLHHTAHINYRSSLIDIASLFINNKASHICNFHRLTNPMNLKIIGNSTLIEIENILNIAKDKIDIIHTLRDKEYAHYDFNKSIAINLSFDNLEVVNELWEIGKIILLKCSTGFEFDENNEQTFYDLKELISQAELIKPI